jgi:hypothetical protein
VQQEDRDGVVVPDGRVVPFDAWPEAVRQRLEPARSSPLDDVAADVPVFATSAVRRRGALLVAPVHRDGAWGRHGGARRHGAARVDGA